MDAAGLWDDRALYGQLLETFIYQELRRQASRQEVPLTFHHFRDREGIEVDVVLEQAGKLAGVGIKAAATVTTADFKGLHKLQDTVGARFRAGVVLYDGGPSPRLANACMPCRYPAFGKGSTGLHRTPSTRWQDPPVGCHPVCDQQFSR